MIALTGPGGEPFWVNPAHVISVQRGPGREGAIIFLAHRPLPSVCQESVETILGFFPEL